MKTITVRKTALRNKTKKTSKTRSDRTKMSQQVLSPLTNDRLQEMKTYATYLHRSFDEIRKVPIAMLLIAGMLAPYLPFRVSEAMAAGTNVIQNPSVETGSAMPDSWNKGGWGTNTATLTYPVAGIDGAKAIRVDITAFTNGDAKWYFTNVPVTAGATYVFSDSYMSDVDTEADLQYTTTGGTTQYLWLGIIPASTATTTKSFTFTMPTNTVSASVFHLIAKVGYLVTDNYSLVESLGSDTTPPTVAITSPTDGSSITATSTVSATATDTVGVSGVQFILDDTNLGAEDIISPYTADLTTTTGTHTLSARARDAVGNIATSSPVSFTVTIDVGNDTTSPTATITAPTEGSTLSGMSTISVNATDDVGVAGVTLLVDGVTTGIEDTTAPYDILWDTSIVANGVHAITGRANDAANNVTASSPVSVTINNPDTTAPKVTLIQPTDGTAVATTTLVSFSATDTIGVSGVKLFVDNIQVGVEDTITPYDFSWDTTSYTNDIHTVYAQARDTAGNIGTSTTANLTVNNIVLPQNLILNPQLETVGTNGDPASWFRGSWGSNTPTFSYPIIGIDGGKATTIDMTNYISGDAKWYFANVAVTGGQTYSFTDSYLSTVPTDIVVQLQTSTGLVYQYIATDTASATWKTETYSVVVPAGVTALTIFHSIAANGSLSVDNYSLTLGKAPLPPSEAFARGLVSFTFDDGWMTQYIDAFPILSAIGFKGTFYVISQETLHSTPVESIQNPSFETVGTNADPSEWFRGGWGTNTATFTYPAVGADGGKAAQLDVAQYTDGDAKWYFGDTPVSPNESYILSDSYQSTVPSVMTLRYTLADNTVQYVDIATIPSSNGTWQNFTKTITIPANVSSVTAFHLLNSNGSLMIDNYSLKMIPIYLDQSEMLQIQNAGNEIGGHTQTHVSLTGALQDGVQVTPAQANAEVTGSRTDLLGMGVTSLTTMAYPYGDYDQSVITMAQNAGFSAARSVERGFNVKNTDKYALLIQQMDRTTTMADVQSWVAQAAADKTWLILMFHQEDANPAHDLGVTVEFLQQIVDYVKTANVNVVTVAQGIAQMNP